MAVEFISASDVVVGIGSVTLDLPPTWAVGDLLLIMSFCPSGAASVPTMGPKTWQYRPSWMYFKRAETDEPSPVWTQSADPNTPMGGFVSAWRGVNSQRGLSSFQFAPEDGGTSGSSYSNRVTIGNITIPGCEIVYCYQSESTDNHPSSVSHTSLTLTQKAFSKDAIAGTPLNCPYGTYTFGLGMWSGRKSGTGASGGLNWSVALDNGGHPQYGNQLVSFFSALVLPEERITASSTPGSGGAVTVSGSRIAGSTITVT
jgi:hypothetical protein